MFNVLCLQDLKSKMEDKLNSLESKLEKIVGLGRSWGMSDTEIKECIEEVIQLQDEDRSKSQETGWQFVLSKIGFWTWFLVKCLAVILSVLILLYFILTTCALFSPEIEVQVENLMTPWIYPSMRIARIVLKPLTDKFHMQGMYTSANSQHNHYEIKKK